MASLSFWFLWTAQSSNSALITLAWDPTSTNAVRVYQAVGTNPFAIVATVTSVASVTLSVDTNTITRWFVTAFNGLESGPSNLVTNMPPPVNLLPSAPTNLRASQVQGWRVDLVWNGSLTTTTEVERADQNGSFGRVATVASGTLHYSDLSVRKRHGYFYRVRSVNQFGSSPYSNSVFYSSQ